MSHPVTEPAPLLAELGRRGLGCPRHLSLRRFLTVLVEAGVVTGETAERVASDDERRWGAEPAVAASPEITEQLVAELEAASADGLIERADEALKALAPAPLPPAMLAAAAKPEPPQEEISELEPPTQPEDQDEQEAESSGRSRRLSRGSTLGLLLAWSAVMLVGGYWGRPLAERWVDITRYRLFGTIAPRWAESYIERRQAELVRHPNQVGRWQAYARFAHVNGHEEEALAALRYLLVRNPDDAELLRTLAWLYMTTEKPYLRDPLAAYELAERAWAVEPTPPSAMVLAEAAMAAGHSERALEMAQEEESLSDGWRRYLKYKMEALAFGE